MFSEAQVGDDCWTIQLGDCEITDTRAGNTYPIGMHNSSGQRCTYTLRGYAHESNAHQSAFWAKPEFVMPPAPKRMMTKSITYWINLYPIGQPCIHPSRESADEAKSHIDRIACVELTGTYEVEE